MSSHQTPFEPRSLDMVVVDINFGPHWQRFLNFVLFDIATFLSIYKRIEISCLICIRHQRHSFLSTRIHLSLEKEFFLEEEPTNVNQVTFKENIAGINDPAHCHPRPCQHLHIFVHSNHVGVIDKCQNRKERPRHNANFHHMRQESSLIDSQIPSKIKIRAHPRVQWSRMERTMRTPFHHEFIAQRLVENQILALLRCPIA
mmetsp:Transcript_661/g.1113  ORF Transcript_661/g.1113 Transcript_661/m.1113 type:complete len:201 (+) Transcript_661:1055-1657(+)